MLYQGFAALAAGSFRLVPAQYLRLPAALFSTLDVVKSGRLNIELVLGRITRRR